MSNTDARQSESRLQLFRRFTRLPFALLVLAVGLGLTVLECRQEWNYEKNETVREHQETAALARDQLMLRLDSSRQMMLSGRALINGSDHVTRDEWRRLVDSIELSERFPEVFGLALIDVVPEASLEDWVLTQRDSGAPEFTVRSPGARSDHAPGADHFIIKYHEPAEINRSVWGIDVSASPANRQPYAESLETGTVHMTPGLTLVQAQDRPSKGIVIAIPVAQHATASSGPRPGWVAVSVALDRCVEQARSPEWDGKRVRILEPSNASMPVLFDSNPGDLTENFDSDFTASVPLEFGGRTWLIQASPRVLATVLPSTAGSVYILATGTVLSVLLSLLIFSISSTRDRAERLTVERTTSLRESESRYRALVNGSPVCIKELDTDGRVLSMNTAGLRMLGLNDESEIVGQLMDDLVMPEDVANVQSEHRKILAGETRSFQFRLPLDSGEVVVMETVVVPRRCKSDDVCCMICVTQNVTERVEAENRIRESESRYRTLVDGAPVCIKEFDADGCFLSMNPAGFAMIEMDPDTSVEGNRFDQLVVPAESEMAARELALVMEGEPRSFQYHIQLESGRVVTLETLIVPSFDQHGEITGMISVSLDVTERVETENRVLETKARLESLTRLAPVGIYRADAKGDCVYVSKRWCTLAGMVASESVGEGWLKGVHPDDRETVREAWETFVRGEASFKIDYRYLRPDESWSWVQDIAVAERDKSGRIIGYVGAVSDLTVRREVEIRLRENEARLNNLTRLAPVGIFRANREGTVVDISERLTQLTGLSREQACREDWSVYIHPEDYEAVSASWQRLVENGVNFDVEYRLRLPDGEWAWFRVQAVPDRDDEGLVTGFVGSMADHTERHAVEDRLRESESRMRELAQQAQAASRIKTEFLANMSHEIRTPMTAILGFTELLGKTIEADDEAVDALETIQRNGRHLLDVVNDVLNISKIEAGQFTVNRANLGLPRMIDEVFELLAHKASAKGLQLEHSSSPNGPTIIATDSVRLRQILVNLIGNAIKFTQNGSVRVVTSAGDAPGSVVIEVTDTGVGLDQNQVTQIFDPFVQGDSTTTRNHGGTGLGLSISRKIAESLGGSLAADPSFQGGSRFVLTLDAVGPIGDAVPAPEKPVARPAAAPDDRPCRVLLAEDSRDSQRLITHHLREAGHEVVTADNGQEAVERTLQAQDEGQPFDLILMDMQMPLLDGYGATESLRAKGYTGRIVALTAHAMDFEKQRCLDAGCDEYATKPIPRQSLLELIHAPRQAA